MGHGFPRNMPLPMWVTMPNLIALCQMLRSYVWRSAVPPFHVTQGRRNSHGLIVYACNCVCIVYNCVCTYDFLLTFHSNSRPVLQRFQDIARYWPKSANFPTPTPNVFNAAAEIPSLRILLRRLDTKTRMMGLPGQEKV